MQIFFKKKLFESILSVHTACWPYAKCNLIHLFFAKFPHLGPILDLFWPKKIKAKFFQKNCFVQYKAFMLLQIYAKKKQKQKTKTKKTHHFGPIFSLFWSKILWRNLFPNKLFPSILSIYSDVTSSKKLKKYHAVSFTNTWKTSIWNHLEPLFGLKASKQAFYPKKLERSILSLYATVTIGKKIRKILSVNFSLNLKTSF